MRKLAVAIIFLLTTVACQAPIEIKSEPNGATVIHDGANAGETPTTIYVSTLGFQTTTTVRLEKKGYETTQKTISVNVNPWNGQMTWPTMDFIRMAKKEEDK